MSIKIDVGCGSSKLDGFIGIDSLKLDGVDIVHDLNITPWPFESSSAKQIVFCHSLSHLDKISKILIECHRILVPGGRLEILAPHFSSDNYFTDPTHKTSIGLRSMNYFVNNVNFDYCYIPKENLFELIESHFSFRECNTSWRHKTKFNPLRIMGIENFFNKIPRLYEKFFCSIMPASEVYFVLKKPH